MKKQCLSLIVASALLLGLLLTGCGQPEKKTEELSAGLLRQYMHNTEIAVTMRLSTILKTIKQPL